MLGLSHRGPCDATALEQLHAPPPIYPGASRQDLAGLGNCAGAWLLYDPHLHMGEEQGLLAALT